MGPVTHVDLEYLVLEWDAKQWLLARDTPLLRIARRLGVSDSVIHLWQKRNMTPFAFFKAAVMLIDPDGAEAVLKKARLVRTTRGFRITPPMRTLAEAYDEKFAGQQVPLKGGGFVAVEAPVVLAGAQYVPPAIDEPDSGYVAEPRMPYSDGALETLLSVALKLKLERDAASQQVYQLSSQLKLEQARFVALQKVSEALRVELQEWQQLAELSTDTVQELAPKATPAQVAEAEAFVAKRAPALTEEIQALPKHPGHRRST